MGRIALAIMPLHIIRRGKIMDESKLKKNVNNTNVVDLKKTENQLIKENEELFDVNNLSMLFEEHEDEQFEDMARHANHKRKLLDENIPVEMPDSYIESAGFATTFNTQLGSFKRFFRSDLRGSRLRAKAENATKIKDDSKEFGKARKKVLSLAKKYVRKKLREQNDDAGLALSANQERDVEIMMPFMKTGKSASDKDIMRMYATNPAEAFKLCVDDFMSIDVSQLKLESDTDFAKSTKKIRAIMAKTEAMKKLLTHHRDSLGDRVIELGEQVEHLDRLSGYFCARGNLLLNNYYITHYNSELTYIAHRELEPMWDGENDATPKSLRKIYKREDELQEVSNLIHGVEMATFFFKHGYNTDDEEAQKEFKDLYKNKLSEKNRLATMDSFVHHSKSIDGAGNTAIGSFLQFVTWVQRAKRRTDYGAPMYNDSVAKLQLLPAVIRNHNFGEDLIKTHGDAPEINLNDYIYDPIKHAIQDTRNDAPDPNAPEQANDHDYKLCCEALDNWLTVKGIVNQDTTHMEMAFLDTFLKTAKHWISEHPGAQNTNDAAGKKYAFLQDIVTAISDNLNGSLQKEIPNDIEYLKQHLPVLREDNTVFKNVEESNVKDIPLFLHQPMLNDVTQAAVGDCWLHAGIQATIAQNPMNIKSMFCDLGDGSVIVRLYRLTDKLTGEPSSDYDTASKHPAQFKMQPIYIRLSKDYEEGDGYANDCLWVQLLERAVAVSGLNGQQASKIKDGKVYNTATEITAGSPDVAMSILTGKLYYLKSKDDEYSLPKASIEEEYGLLLMGIPYRIKEKVCDKIKSAKTANPGQHIAEETLLGYINEEQENYINDCNTVLDSCREIKTGIEEMINNNNLPGDFPNLTEVEEIIKTSLWYKDAEKGFAEIVKGNMRLLEEGDTPSYTVKETLGPEIAIADFNSRLQQIKTAIAEAKKASEDYTKSEKAANQDKADINNKLINRMEKTTALVSAVNGFVLRAHDFKALVSFKGKDLEEKIKTYKRSFFAGKTNDNTVKTQNIFTIYQTKYDMRNYNPAQINALINLRESLSENGGGVAVSFGNHCMTALDTAYKDGRWYVLIRDPFNIYNHKYTKKKNGKLSLNSTGFWSLFRPSYYDKKRHLTNYGEGSNFRSGFRGLSWWTLEEYFAGISSTVEKA